jgi:ubiquinone/menaquinone biosynthesis C-methylase UbiE
MDACIIFALTPEAAAKASGPGVPLEGEQQDVLSQVEEAMRRDWNERARENAMYYVASGRPEWEKDEFFESGKVSTSQLIVQDLDTIRRGLDPKEMVALEIGCGVGRMTMHLADIFGRVEAVDVSGEMIAQARRNLANRTNVGLHETSGSDLAPFPDGLFDFCFSYIVFQHIPFREAIVKYIEEVHRTLKKDRLFKFQVHGGIRVRMSAAQVEKPKMRVGSDGTVLEEVDTWHGFAFSEEEMRELADRIGFEVLQMSGQDSQYFWNWWVRR